MGVGRRIGGRKEEVEEEEQGGKSVGDSQVMFASSPPEFSRGSCLRC